MRIAFAALLVALSASALRQTGGFIVAEYLAVEYTAPEDAPSTGVIAGKW